MEIDRARGTFLGLACGDAVGSTVEFSPRDTVAPVMDMVGGGPVGLAPGEWTDDTSMALCLADSLLTNGTFDAVDQLRRYLRWRREGYLSSTGQCFDVGGTVGRDLFRFARTGDPASGPTDPSTAGNGSLMRLTIRNLKAFSFILMRTERRANVNSMTTSSRKGPRSAKVNPGIGAL